jgi:hypothetical protein
MIMIMSIDPQLGLTVLTIAFCLDDVSRNQRCLREGHARKRRQPRFSKCELELERDF